MKPDHVMEDGVDIVSLRSLGISCCVETGIFLNEVEILGLKALLWGICQVLPRTRPR